VRISVDAYAASGFSVLIKLLAAAFTLYRDEHGRCEST